MDDTNRLELVAKVTASYLRQNSVGVDQIEKVVGNVTRAMLTAAGMLEGRSTAAVVEQQSTAESQQPAVSVRSSVRPDYLVCLECGAKAKTLKRHLMSAHGLDPRRYREKWTLKRDYPMTAPSYSERRSAMARDLGLGRKPGEGKKPRRRSRKAVAAQEESTP